MNKKLCALTAFMLIFAAILLHMNCILYTNSKIGICIADEKEVTKSVYLTFDDGPSDKVTPKILDILKEEDVKATFFIIGKNAERRRYLIEREFNEGHTVAIHSYTHSYRDIYSSAQKLLQDIDACNEIIKQVTGSYSSVYRFPGGSFGLDKELINAVCERGLRYVDWNASTRDAEIWNATPEQLIDAAVTTSSDANNIVLLCHDSTTKTSTAQALKSIIRYYKQNGYMFDKF
jgi:peptidoglycan/xylan/chitin deacetylase (PgdA/CDA1 family)